MNRTTHVQTGERLMANVQNDPKTSGGRSDTPTPTGGMWNSSFPKLGGNANGAKK